MEKKLPLHTLVFSALHDKLAQIKRQLREIKIVVNMAIVEILVIIEAKIMMMNVIGKSAIRS